MRFAALALVLGACALAPVPEPGLTVAAGFANPAQEQNLVGGLVKVDGLALAERVGTSISALGGTYGFDEQAEARILRAQAVLYGSLQVVGLPDVELPGYFAAGLGPARVRDGGEDLDAAYVDLEFGLVEGLSGGSTFGPGIFVASTWSLLVLEDGAGDDGTIFEAVVWVGYRFSL